MTAPSSFLSGKVVLYGGDCREVLATLQEASVDSIVCDPPYALTQASRGGSVRTNNPETPFGRTTLADKGFMGKQWDTGEAAFAVEFWEQCYRVLKPGGHVVAFSGTRTYHRLACAIEDAGFEIRDQLAWCYGSGFPKSHDVSKAIDKAAGAAREVIGEGARFGRGAMQAKTRVEAGYRPTERNPEGGAAIITAPATDEACEWAGWGTALKPAWEPICLARKPLIGTVVANVLAHGTGALNIDGCRVESEGGKHREGEASQDRRYADRGSTNFAATPGPRGGDPMGRFPANLIHDGSPEVLACFPDSAGQLRPVGPEFKPKTGTAVYGDYGPRPHVEPRSDSGSSARFFYTSKADADDRLGSKHPTVKPVDLMQWLVRLVTPKGGTTLDPFAGTGTTGEAAWREGMKAILIEREPEYQADIARRMDLATKPTKRAAVAATKNNLDDPNALPLFGGAK